jgi:hypothetical protein
MEEDVEPQAVASEPTVGAAPVRPEGHVLVAGHAAARYAFVVPTGLARLRGVTAADGESPEELSAQGPDGVGLPGPHPIALDSIVVFSDPLGVGVDMGTASPAARAEIVDRYHAFLRERFPSASTARLTTIGPHTAIRIDLPRVEMPDRPLRSGRHYLVLDGTVTVSVDCVWTAEHAERIAAACDAVAASLRRRAL